VFVNVERKKLNKMWPLCREGSSAKAPLPSVFATTLGNSGKNFRSSGVPSFAERCTWRSTKKVFNCPGLSAQFFLKEKNTLCRRPVPGALGTEFSKKI
jgi:hypothetical protein